MKRNVLILSIAIIPFFYFCSCDSVNPSGKTDPLSEPALISRGEQSFARNCSGCHNFRQGSIGPQLGGITTEAPIDWIRHFIRDPKKTIESGDERAGELFKKYKAAMPSFASLPEDEITAIIAFLNIHKKLPQHDSKTYGTPLSHPIHDAITPSNLLVNLKLITQIPASGDSGKLPLTRITKLDVEPASGRVYILDLRGKLYRMQDNKPAVYMDMAKLKQHFMAEPGLGTGFGSFAFHPDFAKNGLFYTAHSERPGSGHADFDYADSIKVALQYVLTEWKADNPGAEIFSGASRELMRINMPYVIHGIQEIAFNPIAKKGGRDYGNLYVCVGDGGCLEKGYPFLTHSLEKIWGTLLRITPGKPGNMNRRYGIPPDNPFYNSKNDKTLKEIFAYGFKNPHRITWSKSGQILVSNIGEANVESLNLVMPGHDYGWPIREGRFALDPFGDLTKVYPLPADDSVYKITYPIVQYGHDSGWTAIAGGYEYLGSKIPPLKGKFVFGDIPSGRLFFVEMTDIKQGQQAPIKECRIVIDGIKTTLKKLCGNDRVDLHFGKDAREEIYLLSKTDGKIYRLESATSISPL